MFNGFGITTFGELRVPATTQTVFPWAWNSGNKMFTPSHVMQGAISGIVLESNNFPSYFLAANQEPTHIDVTNKQLLLPSYMNAFFTGYSGAALSNRKRALIVFKDGSKVVVDDNS